MSRFIRNTAVLAKAEVTYGTDPVPTGSANAMLASNVTSNPLNAENVDRALLREYFGASEELVGIANMTLQMDVELAASGTLGVAPAWAPLLRACGAAETITTDELVEYNPITDDADSVTIYWYDSGVVHKMLGARGRAQFNMSLGGKPVITYNFIGLYGGVTAAVLPTTDYDDFQVPLVVTNANTGDVNLGCTYTAGVLSSGTDYPSRGLEVDGGSQVEHVALLGDESVDLTGRTTVGKLQLALTAAQEVTFATNVRANTLQSLGFVHGTVAGNICVFYGPSVQLTNYSKADYKGRRLLGYDARFLPDAGNDEWVLALR
ncbi:MAG: hypothetical protein K0R58_238 [Ramlibacter sp.]|jgi:hypothetical protein|nr:hypothetical protein [Ramlibacter sp.]